MKQSTQDISLLVMRISLGGVMFAHGAQKLFGWFGGFGFAGTMGYFTETLGLPWLVGFLVVIGESLGAVALMLGLFGRLMSGSIAVIMLGALYFEHAQYGFFMNWFGTASGEGIEFDLLVFGLALPLVFLGSGKYSLDHGIGLIKKNS